MSKQCPSSPAAPVITARVAMDDSSRSARYWHRRVFKNTFTRNGRRYSVKCWSVKIQVRGQRRAFSLTGATRAAAALEAESLHNLIVQSGWEAAIRRHESQRSGRMLASLPGTSEVQPFTKSLAHWKRRLIRRRYLEAVRSSAGTEFCARIEHAGQYSYFPLGTADQSGAAARALEIFQTIRARGWKTACELFEREITMAIFWASDPVACSYTTLLTLPNGASAPLPAAGHSGRRKRLVTVEPDLGLHKTLSFWLNQQPGFEWVAGPSKAAELVAALRRNRADILLINRLLANADHLLQVLKVRFPDLPVFTYGIYEESDQIFMSVSGVDAGYLLRRRVPTALLEPIQGALRLETLSAASVFSQVKGYFQSFFGNSSTAKERFGLLQLTNREQQILSYVTKGYIDKEIAQALQISVWTVHNHLKSSYEKLKVHTRTEAALRFLQR
ncbi:MAG TPA: response regulator transcription factor [Patescibacteria group bacterium]|nr:response regulator transcription factor [Patescibacteria group bacterium]